MRLLPLLPALLSELVALQPRLDVLSVAKDISMKCVRIGFYLPFVACGEQSSQSGSSKKVQGVDIMRGVFGACLEVLVPVQQHLATLECSAGDDNGIGGTGSHAHTHNVVTGCDQRADAEPKLLAKSVAGTLFWLLAGSMYALGQGESHMACFGSS